MEHSAYRAQDVNGVSQEDDVDALPKKSSVEIGYLLGNVLEVQHFRRTGAHNHISNLRRRNEHEGGIEEESKRYIQ